MCCSSNRFLENRDAIRWIKALAIVELPYTQICVSAIPAVRDPLMPADGIAVFEKLRWQHIGGDVVEQVCSLPQKYVPHRKHGISYRAEDRGQPSSLTQCHYQRPAQRKDRASCRAFFHRYARL